MSSDDEHMGDTRQYPTLDAPMDKPRLLDLFCCAGGAGLASAADESVTWRELSHRIREHTGIRVSHESLRVWHEEWSRGVEEPAA